MNVDSSSQPAKQTQATAPATFEAPNTVYAAVARSLARPIGYFYKNANPQQMFAPAAKIEIVDILHVPYPNYVMVPSVRNPTLKQVVRLPVTWKVFLSVIREKGVKEFVRMVGPPIVANSILGTVIFEVYRSSLSAQHDDPNSPADLHHVLRAGALSGFTQSFLACPMDSVKIRLTSEHFQNAAAVCSADNIHLPNSNILSKVTHSSIIDLHNNQNVIQTIKHMRREPYGVFGSLYQGLGLTIARDSIAFAAFFWSYEFCKKCLSSASGSNGHPLIYVFSGGIAGVSSFLLAHPFDTIKEDLMHHGSHPIPLQTAIKSFVELVKHNGTAAFTGGSGFKGLLKVFPASAIGFLIYEMTLKELDTSSSSSHK